MAAILMYSGEDTSPIAVLPNDFDNQAVFDLIRRDLTTWCCPPNGEFEIKLDPLCTERKVFYIEEDGHDFDPNSRYHIEETKF